MPGSTLAVAVPPHRWSLLGAKQPVPRIAQTGEYIAVNIEAVVNGRGVDGYIRVLLVHVGNAFWGRQQTDEFERPGTRILESVQGRHRRIASGEHGIDDEDITCSNILRDFKIILDGDERLRIAIQTDVTNTGDR